jgi:ABC-type protease/lipase transport system fused ATPase/permease subunit
MLFMSVDDSALLIALVLLGIGAFIVWDNFGTGGLVIYGAIVVAYLAIERVLRRGD